MRLRSYHSPVLLGLGAALLLTGSLRAQSSALPDDRLGMRTAPLLLLSRQDVRADLRLNANQIQSAEQAISQLYIRASSLKGKTGTEAVAARKAIDNAQRDWFDANLSTAQQNRLVQIDLQWEGPSALVSRKLVADTLGLSPEQRTSLKEAVAKRDAARARQSDRKTTEAALAKETLSALNPAQKERWRSMLGAPFIPQFAANVSAESTNPKR